MRPRTLRGLLLAEGNGVLATLSARRSGWPFASIAAYALSDAGEPLLLLSGLAEHTRNLSADGRASLLVRDSAAGEDPQAGARVTLLGTIALLGDQESDRARNTYIQRHPEAADYFNLGDFRLYKMRVTEARFVNGFGDMGWLRAEELRAALTQSQ